MLEAQPTYGGAVRSASRRAPGLRARHVQLLLPAGGGLAGDPRPAASRSTACAGRTPRRCVGTPFRSGGWAELHRDRERTAAGSTRTTPGDGDAWLRLCAVWDRVGADAVDALMSPFPPVRRGAAALRRLPGPGALALLRAAARVRPSASRSASSAAAGPRCCSPATPRTATSPLELAGLRDLRPAAGDARPDRRLPGPRRRRRVARPGAGRPAGVPRRRGGLRHPGRAGRWSATAGPGRRAHRGRRDACAARGRCSPTSPPPPCTAAWCRGTTCRRAPATLMRRFRWDPGTVKVDWALSGPVPWADRAVGRPRARCTSRSRPRRSSRPAPGRRGRRTRAAVPARRADGHHRPDPGAGRRGVAVGLHARAAARHVRRRRRRRSPGAWDDGDDASGWPTGCRPGSRSTPPASATGCWPAGCSGRASCEARDANLVDGAVNGGTGALHQQLVLRPVPGSGGAETPVRGLYLASSSAHPGGGVHGACGANAAHAALRSGR